MLNEAPNLSGQHGDIETMHILEAEPSLGLWQHKCFPADPVDGALLILLTPPIVSEQRAKFFAERFC